MSGKIEKSVTCELFPAVYSCLFSSKNKQAIYGSYIVTAIQSAATKGGKSQMVFTSLMSPSQAGSRI